MIFSLKFERTIDNLVSYSKILTRKTYYAKIWLVCFPFFLICNQKQQIINFMFCHFLLPMYFCLLVKNEGGVGGGLIQWHLHRRSRKVMMQLFCLRLIKPMKIKFLICTKCTLNQFWTKQMYILASVTINTYLKLEIRVVSREFLALNTYLSFFSKQIRLLFIFVHQKFWKLAFRNGFSRYTISIVFVLAGWE